MKLHRTVSGIVVESDGGFHALDDDWNELLAREDLLEHLRAACARVTPAGALGAHALAPVGAQEVWAAGVTYRRSRDGRVEESQADATVYDRVYDAARPELFFKAAAWRARGPGQPVRVRRDARWSVPEPEIALVVDPRGTIVGYTIGNDLSSRDIEGENPLYLPQAKIYDGACALGPALLVAETPLPAETTIAVRVTRGGATAFEGSTTWGTMRRDPRELVEYLYRETSFPHGCVLLTGTGVVPPADFTLRAGDEIAIHVPPIGTLSNVVDAD